VGSGTRRLHCLTDVLANEAFSLGKKREVELKGIKSLPIEQMRTAISEFLWNLETDIIPYSQKQKLLQQAEKLQNMSKKEGKSSFKATIAEAKKMIEDIKAKGGSAFHISELQVQ